MVDAQREDGVLAAVEHEVSDVAGHDGDERVLRRDGEPRRFFYRFSNPLMQPYVILRSLSDAILSDEILTEMRGEVAPPSEQTPLV